MDRTLIYQSSATIGLKPGGADEWLVEKHGTSRRRFWRKLHTSIDAGSGEIVAIELTEKDVDDAARTDALLDQVNDPVEQCVDFAQDEIVWRFENFRDVVTVHYGVVQQRFVHCLVDVSSRKKK